MIKSQYQKQLFTLNMFPKNKQNKLRQTKKKEMKEGSYLLNYTFFIRKNFIKK